MSSEKGLNELVHCVTISLFSAGCQFSDALPSPPLPAYRRGIQLLSVLHCAPGACCKLRMASHQSDKSWWPRHRADISRARHGLTSWLITLLIDCFPACGVRAVTFNSPHSADIQHKLLKLLLKYINKVRI